MLLFAVACGGRGGRDDRASPSPGGQPAGGRAAGGGGQMAKAGEAGIANGAAGASGAGGQGGGGGAVASGPLVPLVKAELLTREVQVDSDYFYYVTHTGAPPHGPGDIVRVARDGGKRDVLVSAVGGARADLQLHDGVLYFRSATEVRAYRLASGEVSVIHTLGSDPNGNPHFSSLRAGPSGLFWTTFVRNLFRYDYGTQQVEPVADQEVEVLLKVEADHLISRAILPTGPATVIHELATGKRARLAPPAPFDAPFTGALLDEDWYYRLDDHYPASGQPQLERYPRVGSEEGMPPTQPEVMLVPILTSAEMLLWQRNILVRKLDSLWYAISTDDFREVELPELKSCSFLFSGNEELFCAGARDGSYFVFEVTDQALP
jgi:hypothetical protein